MQGRGDRLVPSSGTAWGAAGPLCDSGWCFSLQSLQLRGPGIWSRVLLREHAASCCRQARGVQQRVQGAEGLCVRRGEPPLGLQHGAAAGRSQAA